VTPAGLHGALAGLTDATITASDTVIFADVGSSNALKEDTVQGILDLAPGAAKNLIINGEMRIAQRGTSFTGLANGQYGLDRWRYHETGAAVIDVTQDTDVPGSTFTNSLKLDVTTVDSSIAAGDIVQWQQKIEGFNCQPLRLGTSDAVTFTLSFWVKAVKAGIYCVAFLNSARDRSYVAEYTISSSSTWEYKTVTVAGDTSGTWLTDSGIGLRVGFTLASGTDFHGTNATWEGARDHSTSNQVNGVDNTSNNFWLTGVQLEVGAAATDFEHVDYGSELARCERYFVRFNGDASVSYIAIGQYQGTTQCRTVMVFPTTMRTAPTVTVSDVTHFNVFANSTETVSGVAILGVAQNKVTGLDVTTSAAVSGSVGSVVIANSSGYIEFSAEL
jgi:hypothetical protein